MSNKKNLRLEKSLENCMGRINDVWGSELCALIQWINAICFLLYGVNKNV